MDHKMDADHYWTKGEEWSIEGEIRIPNAQEELSLGYLLFDEENRMN